MTGKGLNVVALKKSPVFQPCLSYAPGPDLKASRATLPLAVRRAALPTSAQQPQQGVPVSEQWPLSVTNSGSSSVMDRAWVLSREGPFSWGSMLIPLEIPYLCTGRVESGLNSHFQSSLGSCRIFHGWPHCPHIYRILGHQT